MAYILILLSIPTIVVLLFLLVLTVWAIVDVYILGVEYEFDPHGGWIAKN